MHIQEYDLNTLEGIEAALAECGSMAEVGRRYGFAPSTLKDRRDRLNRERIAWLESLSLEELIDQDVAQRNYLVGEAMGVGVDEETVIGIAKKAMFIEVLGLDWKTAYMDDLKREGDPVLFEEWLFQPEPVV